MATGAAVVTYRTALKRLCSFLPVAAGCCRGGRAVASIPFRELQSHAASLTLLVSVLRVGPTSETCCYFYPNRLTCLN